MTTSGAEAHTMFESGARGMARATVVVPLFNYAHLVLETLDSVAAQTLPDLELIVVDDASTDASLAVATEWMRHHEDRFSRTVVLHLAANEGLAASRNHGVQLASAPAYFPLDADNVLYPRCLEQLATALERSDAAFAYCMLEVFESGRDLMGTDLWDPARLARDNYIDAMALIRTDAWRAVGGYSAMGGWEDYDLWCKFHETGRHGVQVPNILARYRLHFSSMLRTMTNKPESRLKVVAEMRRRHPWLASS